MTTATAQAGPLKSDHINYLILRYLQEAGHEASATAFYRDWRRPAEYRDPEDLPFAHSVQRHELVSVIQDGLYHDELVSRVRKGERRFNFTAHGVGSGSRPGTAGKGKGRLDQMRRGTEDFPTPPPKRQRKVEEAPQERHINGAAAPMDVDAASPSVGDAEDDTEGASPAVQTPEPEIVEVPERYDSMDVAVQTEGKTGPKTSTMYWRVGKPDTTILHSAFSPAKASRALYTAGEGISQFYDLPRDFESGIAKITSLDDGSTSAGSVVTACAWHPEGHALAFAVDMAREIGFAGKQERRQVIKIHDAKSSRTTQYYSPPLLEPQGIVLALRYSWDGSHLLAVRTNGSRGTVEIWRTESGAANGAMHSADIAAWNVFEDRILDAAWTSQSEFVICGDDGLLQPFKLTSAQDHSKSLEQTYTSETTLRCGLELLRVPVVAVEAQHLNFDKLRASLPEDRSAPTASVPFVVVASEDRAIVQYENETCGVPSYLGGGRITALAFRPPPGDSATDAASLPASTTFAFAQENGDVTVHQLGLDIKSHNHATRQLADGSPALALAWSPEGSYLAVSGVDIVQIWEARPLVQRNRVDLNAALEPIVTWRRDRSAAVKGLRNGEHTANGNANGEGNEPLLEPSLSWSADGESLALAVGNEIAVIRFRPPLHDRREDGVLQVNGHGS